VKVGFLSTATGGVITAGNAVALHGESALRAPASRGGDCVATGTTVIGTIATSVLASYDVQAVIGNHIDFAVPAWAKIMDISFTDITSNSTKLLIRVGDAALDFTSHTYSGTHTRLSTGVDSAQWPADAVDVIDGITASAHTLSGKVSLVREAASNDWGVYGRVGSTEGAATMLTAGGIGATAAVAWVRFCTNSVNDRLLTGSVSVLYR
jgi:hypothetical protein